MKENTHESNWFCCALLFFSLISWFCSPSAIGEAVACSHGRAHVYFTESILTDCPFTAFPCDNYVSVRRPLHLSWLMYTTYRLFMNSHVTFRWTSLKGNAWRVAPGAVPRWGTMQTSIMPGAKCTLLRKSRSTGRFVVSVIKIITMITLKK